MQSVARKLWGSAPNLFRLAICSLVYDLPNHLSFGRLTSLAPLHPLHSPYLLFRFFLFSFSLAIWYDVSRRLTSVQYSSHSPIEFQRTSRRLHGPTERRLHFPAVSSFPDSTTYNLDAPGFKDGNMMFPSFSFGFRSWNT